MRRKDVKAIAERLTQAVDACEPKLTRTRLAKKLSLSPGAISHYLNGNRPVPERVVKKIAQITKVEPGWLLHGTPTSDAHLATAPLRSASSGLSWGFRVAPADGGKDFGNAGIYATPMAIRTVVREDGQNSLDAGCRPEVVLRFRLVELSPNCKRYERVLNALRFEQLRERIRAIEETTEFESKLGTKLSAGLEHVLEEKLILLYVDDYGTHGLIGDEFDSTKAYCALVRDNLNSRKDNATAGGIFGVGAKANIACSQLSTVLFSSKIAGHDDRTRLVGRTEMTYHELREGGRVERFAGPGWFGEPTDSGVVESAWLQDDDPLLDALMLRRDRVPRGVRRSDVTGTSILIVGFTDPQTEAGATTQQLTDQFIEAAAVNFWPAIVRGSLTVWVERYVDDADEAVKSEQVDPKSIAGVAELCDAWDKQHAGKTTPVLTAPGDVVDVTIPMTVPATRPRGKGVKPHDELQAECQLIVRLADPENTAGDPRVGEVAYIRGRAMVTRYQNRARVVGGRAFHAALLAGTLVGKSTEQVAAEEFLRIAEPPAHDRWVYNPDLGERYARGAKKALDELFSRVTEELQRVLRPPVSRSGDGPEVLRRLLQFRRSKEAAPKQPQVRILRSSARVIDDAWVIDAELSVNPTSRVLAVTPRLSFACEGSAPIPVGWRGMSANDDGTEVRENTLILKPRTKRVVFHAESDPATHPVDAGESSAVLDVLARAEEGES